MTPSPAQRRSSAPAPIADFWEGIGPFACGIWLGKIHP